MFGNNSTSSKDYWYIVLPLLVFLRSGGTEKIVVKVRRPSLHTILFFVGIGNLLRAFIAKYDLHVHIGILAGGYASAVVLALVAGELVEKLAKSERAGRLWTGLLGCSGFVFTTVSTSSGVRLMVQLGAVGFVVFLTVTGEIGYLVSGRVRARRDGGPGPGQDPAPAASAPAVEPDAIEDAAIVELASDAERRSQSGGNQRRRRRGRGGRRNGEGQPPVEDDRPFRKAA
jgi:hypothetical protein